MVSDECWSYGLQRALVGHLDLYFRLSLDFQTLYLPSCPAGGLEMPWSRVAALSEMHCAGPCRGETEYSWNAP